MNSYSLLLEGVDGTGRMRLLVNASAFNLTNTTHFANPSGSFATASVFGRISSSFGERQIR